MKIIEGMKRIKELLGKVSDLKEKVATHCADSDFETPLYTDQRAEVTGWIQGIRDTLFEVENLRFRIQKTNIATPVQISVGDKVVTKSIAEWIHRRRDLAGLELLSWSALTDRGIREGTVKQSNGVEREIKIRRYYDAKERDKKIEQLKAEPHLIDSRMEVVNAVTDLLE